MADPRPQDLTLPNRIVNVVETSIIDLIAVNSGTCTGDFQTNSLTANTGSFTSTVTAGHVVTNSGTVAGQVTAGTFQANNGIFLSTLVVSGIPVDITGRGISSLVEDPSPTLGGDLSGNSHNITGVAGVTANTGYFPVSCTAGSFLGNTMSLALTGSADHFTCNSGTFATNVRVSGVLKLGIFTTTQRNALAAEDGMLILNSSTGALNFYNNGAWRAVLNL